MTGSPWSADNNLRNVLMTFVEKYCHLHHNSHLDYSQQKLKLLICTAMVLIVAKTAKEPERQTLPALSIKYTIILYFCTVALIAPKQWILTTLLLSVSDILYSSSTNGRTNSGLCLPRTRKISGASILTLSSASYRSFSNTGI